jgi:hypothetical protein
MHVSHAFTCAAQEVEALTSCIVCAWHQVTDRRLSEALLLIHGTVLEVTAAVLLAQQRVVIRHTVTHR